jgi:hypothetical protein
MFDNKTHYNKHLLRKIPCKKLINTILDHDVLEKLEEPICFQMFPKGIQMETFGNTNDYKYKCLICNKIYQNRSGLFKHKKQKHPNYETDIKNINHIQNEKSEIEKFKELFMIQINKLEYKNRELDNKNKELELLVKTSKPKNNTTNINTTNSNNTNNGIINNIQIVQFGKESSELLTKEEISKILYDRGIDGLLASIEVLHFNNRLPQYKNIRLTNLKSKYIDVHNGIKWIKENQDKVLNDTLENHTYHLQTICDDTGNSKRIKNSVKNIINDYSEANKLDTEEKKLTNNKKTIKKINNKKEDVKLFIYNNSKLEEDKQFELLLDV